MGGKGDMVAAVVEMCALLARRKVRRKQRTNDDTGKSVKFWSPVGWLDNGLTRPPDVESKSPQTVRGQGALGMYVIPAKSNAMLSLRQIFH